jgi:hypothetical protein
MRQLFRFDTSKLTVLIPDTGLIFVGVLCIMIGISLIFYAYEKGTYKTKGEIDIVEFKSEVCK